MWEGILHIDMPALPDILLLETRDEQHHLNPRGMELLKCSLGVTITAGAFVVLRLGLRARKKLLGWDDFWIVWAMVRRIPIPSRPAHRSNVHTR